MRPLTDKGKKQAAAARDAWFAKDVVRTSNKCLVTSGARRAAETLQVFGEQVTANKGFFAKLGLGCGSSDAVAFAVSSELVGGLHPAGIAPACEALFDKHGYAPLAKFYAMEGGKEAYAEYGELVCKELAATVDKVSDASPRTRARDVCCVCTAMCVCLYSRRSSVYLVFIWFASKRYYVFDCFCFCF